MPSPRDANRSGRAIERDARDLAGSRRQCRQAGADHRRRHRDRAGDRARLRRLRGGGCDLRSQAGAARVGARRAGGGRGRVRRGALRHPRARPGALHARHRAEALRRRGRPRQQRGRPVAAPAEEISAKGWRAVHQLTVDATWDLTHEVATRSMNPGGRPDRFQRVLAAARDPRLRRCDRRSRRAREPRHGPRGGVEPPRSARSASAPATSRPRAWPATGEILERSRRQVPLGPLGRPDEVGEVIAFLASPGGAYITGTTIVVDGGVDAWGLGEPPPPPEAAG